MNYINRIFMSMRTKKIPCHHLQRFHSNRVNLNKKPKIIPFKKIVVTIPIAGLLVYDGVVNNFVYIGATKRFIRSLSVAFLIIIDYASVIRKENEPNYDELLKGVHLKSANRLLQACLINGGLYIKVGQGVAAMNHILPDEFTTTLSKLQDQCLPYDKKDVQQVFLNDFGKLPEQIYDEFDYEPIASASLAQVFKAKLKNDGKQVAVKVQYNDLEKRFPSDLGTIIFLQDIFEIFFKNYNFGWIVRTVRTNLEQELDFINEGKNSEKCSEDLKKLKYVHVPKIYWDHTNKRVLTMEWIDGFKITDAEKLKSFKINLSHLDTQLFNTFSEQIFNCGFVHADPHPGNIFVRKLDSGEIQLVLLDHGLYESLPENVRIPLCKFWEATVLKDEQEMEKNALRLKINSYQNFAEVLFQVPYETNAPVKTKLTDEDIKYMQEIGKHHFSKIMNTLQEMPRNMLFIVRNLNTIRAISREHGDPVDRPKLMARYAQKCLYTNRNSFMKFLKWLNRRIFFEYCLIKKSMKLSILLLYIDMLYFFGRSPEKSKTIFNFNEAK